MDSEDNIKSKLTTVVLVVFNIILYSIIFLCLSFIFRVSKINAQTINTNYYFIESITNQWGIGTTSYSNYILDYNHYIMGFRWTPYYDNNTAIPLTKSDYSVLIDFDVVLALNWQAPIGPTSSLQIQVYNNGWVNASCDGTQNLALLSANPQNNWYRYHIEYTCTLLNVTQDFSGVRIWFYDQNIGNNNQTFAEFQVNTTQFLDLNEISTGDQAIINNQNQNTDKIVKEQQETNEQLEELNDFFNNDTITNHSSIFGDINFNSTGAISGIITTPLSAIQSLTSNTCSDLVLPLPFVNENLTLPCMTPIYTQYAGTFFTIYQTIILGITAYWVFLNIFKMVQGFADPMEDRIEVLDL